MKSIEVVAAVIRNKSRVFATRRGYGAYKDWWEFPGGKVEAGEPPEEALAREINDLAVDPAFQGRGIATELLESCIADVMEKGMAGVNLITAGEGILPTFYEKHGFQKENRVILMGREL